MRMFRKRPVEIEAVQFVPEHGAQAVNAIVQWGEGHIVHVHHPTPHLLIATKEGTMTAPANWWIIKGVAGEFYPCDPDIFAATYDLVTDPTHD